MRKFFLAAVIALTSSVGAMADTVTNLGINPDSGVGAFSNTNPGTGLGGSGLFVDAYNFQLVGSQILTIAFATNTYAGGASQFITNFQGSVLDYGGNGVLGGGDDSVVIGPALAQACAAIPNCQTFGGSAFLPGGFYGLLISGDAGINAGYGGNLSTFAPPEVPLPAAVWLFGSGIAGLWALQRRRKKTMPPQEAIPAAA